MRPPLAALSLLYLPAVLLLGACEPPRSTSGPAPDPTSRPVARPDTLRDTLRIEGLPEPVVLLRFDEPGVPFTAYYPSDVAPDVGASGEGLGVRFHAAFGGTRRDDAYLAFFFPSEASGMASMSGLLALLEGPNGLFESNGWAYESVRPDGGTTPCDWAAAAYRFEPSGHARSANGTVCVGRHDGRAFYVLEHVPDALAEGFAPRAARLLDTVRWRSDGTRLGGTVPRPDTR